MNDRKTTSSQNNLRRVSAASPPVALDFSFTIKFVQAQLKKHEQWQSSCTLLQVSLLLVEIRSDEINLWVRTTVSALVLAPAGDPAPKPASDIVVDNTESGDQAVGDVFNDWIWGRKAAVEAHKNCINVETPSAYSSEPPVKRSSRIRHPRTHFCVNS